MTSPGSTVLGGSLRAPRRELRKARARWGRKPLRALALLLVLSFPAQGPAMSWKELLGLGDKPVQEAEGPPVKEAWESFADLWTGFKDLKFVTEIVVALLLATVLSALIAYHPRTYGKAATLEEVDQPKIFIMYSVVGAIVAVIVKAYPSMALVVFGIGGLLRFRTDVGAARDTGRVILVTIIGLACGLKIYPMAILGTAFGWILIWILESRVTHRMLVKGLDPTVLAQSAEAHEEVLIENGLQIMSKKMNFVKGQVAFVFRAPGELDREELQQLFKDIPPKLQGAVDWESN